MTSLRSSRTVVALVLCVAGACGRGGGGKTSEAGASGAGAGNTGTAGAGAGAGAAGSGGGGGGESAGAPGSDAASGSDAAPDDASPADAPVATMMIGAQGGTLTTSDGVVIEIPAGALATDTQITVTRSGSPAMGAVGPIFELGPDGTRFAQPVTLTLHYDPGQLAANQPGDLMLATLVNGAWSGAGFAVVDSVSHAVTGYVSHFSKWAVVPSPQGAQCQLDYGCFTGCCGTQIPDFCCSAQRNTCHCATGRNFPSFVACYADCVKTPQASNFASSPCMSACCRAQAGTVTHGACVVTGQPAWAAVLTCAQGCKGPGEQMALCQRGAGDINFEACSWDVKTQGNIGDVCTQGGVNSQFLYSNFRSIPSQIWGNPPTVRVDSGNLSSTSLSAQVSCVEGTGSGTINATWNGSLFDGTWSLGSSSGSITIAPNWRLMP